VVSSFLPNEVLFRTFAIYESVTENSFGRRESPERSWFIVLTDRLSNSSTALGPHCRARRPSLCGPDPLALALNAVPTVDYSRPVGYAPCGSVCPWNQATSGAQTLFYAELVSRGHNPETPPLLPLIKPVHTPVVTFLFYESSNSYQIAK